MFEETCLYGWTRVHVDGQVWHFHHGYIMLLFLFSSHVVRDVLDDVTQSVTDALWVTL